MSSCHSTNQLTRKVSFSNWSVNFFSMARERINSIATSLASSVEQLNQSHHNHLSRHSSWSPEHHQQQHLKAFRMDSGLYIYSIFDDHQLRISPSFYSNHKQCSSTTVFEDEFQCDTRVKLDTLSAGKLKSTFSRYKPGSLESVDFEEEDEYGSTSSPDSNLSYDYSSTSLDASLSDQASISLYDETLSLELPLSQMCHDTLDDNFTKKMDYPPVSDIKLYCDLGHILDRKRGKMNNPSKDAKNTCARFVNRFGLGYEDQCKFPLVLPVFPEINLLKQYVSWDMIYLIADAELARWEYSAVTNLRQRFNCDPILGMPTDWVCPDPNLYLRQICSQFTSSKNGFLEISIPKTIQKNRALKRWSSFEDLHSVAHFKMQSHSQHQELPPNKCHFQMDYCSTASSSIFQPEFVLKSEKASNQTHLTGSGARFNQLISSISSTTSVLSHSDQSSHNITNQNLFQEMFSLLNSSPAHFALYLTKFYLELYQKSFDVSLLFSLVFVKNIYSKRKLQTLHNLLNFDDTLVCIVRHYFWCQGPPSEQAKCLMHLIETACLLRQLNNFYGLRVLIGAIQSPAIYFTTDAWLHLAYRMPNHFRFVEPTVLCSTNCNLIQSILFLNSTPSSDYQKLSRIVRRLDNNCITGVSQPHIPCLSALINRFRLTCNITWDLHEANRRFTEHPTLSGWFDNVSNNERRDSSKNTSVNICTSLLFNSLRKTYLSDCAPIRISRWKDFPANHTNRHIASIPQRYLHLIMPYFRSFFESEANISFRHYRLPDKFY